MYVFFLFQFPACLFEFHLLIFACDRQSEMEQQEPEKKQKKNYINFDDNEENTNLFVFC